MTNDTFNSFKTYFINHIISTREVVNLILPHELSELSAGRLFYTEFKARNNLQLVAENLSEAALYQLKGNLFTHIRGLNQGLNFVKREFADYLTHLKISDKEVVSLTLSYELQELYAGRLSLMEFKARNDLQTVAVGQQTYKLRHLIN